MSTAPQLPAPDGGGAPGAVLPRAVVASVAAGEQLRAALTPAARAWPRVQSFSGAAPEGRVLTRRGCSVVCQP